MSTIEVATPWGIVEETTPDHVWGKFPLSKPDEHANDDWHNRRHLASSVGFDAWLNGDRRIAEAKVHDLECFERIARWSNKIRVDYKIMARTHDFYIEPRLLVSGVDLTRYVELSERFARNGWRRTRTGKFQIRVGDYGNKKVFPERKDGTFSYQKIAEELFKWAVKVSQEEAQKRQRERNKQTIQKLHDRYSYDVQPSSDPEKPARLNLQINQDVTLDTAKYVMKVLEEHGVVRPWDSSKEVED